MKIEGTGNIARELRQLAGDVSVRRDLEESSFDKDRLSALGELLLIAADMAAVIDGLPPEVALPPAAVDECFDDMVYREWPDSPPDPSA